VGDEEPLERKRQGTAKEKGGNTSTSRGPPPSYREKRTHKSEPFGYPHVLEFKASHTGELKCHCLERLGFKDNVYTPSGGGRPPPVISSGKCLKEGGEES